MLQESILQYFPPALSYLLILRPLFCLFWVVAQERFYCSFWLNYNHMANGQVLKHRVFTTYIGDVLVILTWKKIKKVLDYVFKFIHESGRFDHNETFAHDESL